MSGFSNPIVGGGGSLVYPSIHSPNFVHLVTGWSINKDGTAEFTGLILTGGTFTGTNFVINSLGAFYYSGTPATGNLIASITPAAGPNDGVGNPFKAGVNNYVNTGGSAGLTVQLFNGVISFLDQQSPDPVTHNSSAGVIHASAAGQSPITFMDSPSTDAGALHSSIWLIGKPTGAGNARILLWDGVDNTNFDLMVAGVLQFCTVSGGVAVAANGMQLGPASEFQFNSALLVDLAAAANALEIQLSTDTNFRLAVDQNGKHLWGTGLLPGDTNLYRAGVAVLETDGSFKIGTPAATISTDAAGYPVLTDSNGLALNNSGCQPASGNKLTVTTATFGSLGFGTIPANNAEANAVYEFECGGYGTNAAVALAALTLQARFGASPGAATDVVGTAFTANPGNAVGDAFQWSARVRAQCLTSGAAATWRIWVTGTITDTVTGFSVPFAVGTGPTDITQDSTAAINMGLSAKWASVTNGPTITKSGHQPGRRG